jgi:phage terminase small subunit
LLANAHYCSDVNLTAKQLRFVEEYLVDLNAAAAARRAGYSDRAADRQGYENLRKPEIQEAIEAAQAERAGRVEISQNYVIENLTEIVERCMERAPVMVREGRHMVQMKDDEDRDVWRFDSKGAVAALTLLGKHLGMFRDKPNLNVNVDLDNLTDEQLEHLARGGSLDGLPR